MPTPASNYNAILSGLKEKIRQARQKAALTVNTELLSVYWEIGNTILLQQKEEGWGSKVIDRLAVDLKTEFPEMKGLSVRNFKYMRAFAEAYPRFVQQPAAQMQSKDNQLVIIVQQVAAQLPWGHHQLLLDKIKLPAEREFYTSKAVENGWSRNVLAAQIQSQLHLRQGSAITNFEITLPKPQSDLARETLKNPYVFDFLGIGEEMQERELEKALIQHMKKFMLELGRGFAYVGNQYNLVVQGDDYFLDMLFYNYHLHCFVVFELKVGDFKPEFAGKLNFYVNTVNEQVKGKEDKPTIGVLLCKTPNDTVIKYSLQGIESPMGVADYQFTNALPKQLKGEMPTIEELEQELDKEIEILRKPIDEKKNKLKEILSRMKGEELKKVREAKDIIYIFNEVTWPIKERTEKLLESELLHFAKTSFARRINNTASEAYTTPDLEARLQKNENITQLGLSLSLDGFKKAGTKAFGFSSHLIFQLEEFKYKIGPGPDEIWEERLYHQQWTDEELQLLAERWSEMIIDAINSRLEGIF